LSLPLAPPVAPQLARPRASLPDDEGWAYEPKWDGFRAIAFIDGAELLLQSRTGRPLGRYFPELQLGEGRAVVDGEIVVFDADGQPDFDTLQMRLHPAASRVAKLAGEIPVRFQAFDLLADGDEVLLERPFAERRERLEALVPSLAGASLDLTPQVGSAAEAERWLHDAEGVIAKELAAPYRPGERVGMAKIRRTRTIDCVVMGYRPGKEPATIGSLILGLYDEAGELHGVGHSSGFKGSQKRSLLTQLEPLRTGDHGSGAPSRWTQGRDLEWVALRPELVAEISFDHVSGGRIRHGARLLRFRDDKPPRECKLEQLES